MLRKLKQTHFGKVLYRLSRTSLGVPLRWAAVLLQHEALDPAHLSARNRAHNRRQTEILSRFEAENGGAT